MPQVPIDQAMQMAVQCYLGGRLRAAEAVCRQILGSRHDHAESLNLLAVIVGHAGRNDEATGLINRAIAAAPGNAEYHCNLGLFLKKQGRLDEAIASCRRAIAIKPELVDAHRNLGDALGEKGMMEEAIDSYRRAIELKPDSAEIYYNLANAWRSTGQLAPAIDCYQRAVALKPDFADGHNNLGVALNDAGRVDEAIESYRRALALRPDFPQAHYNLGNVLRITGRLDDAITSYQAAVALKSDYLEAQNNLGSAWRDKGQVDQAVLCYRRAMAIRPDHPLAYNNLGIALGDKGELDESIAAHRRAIQLQPDYTEADSNLIYALNFHPAYDAALIHAEQVRWNRQHAEPLKRFIRPHANDRNPDRALRIGYVSPDLRNHPVGRFMTPLLAGHDRKAFQIFCYAQVVKPDELTATLRGYADTGRSIVGLSDEQTAEIIRQDGIDILVDLAMHTGNNRLLVFARKPAPVQVAYLAYAGGTAVDSIDYRLTDRHLDPDDAEDHWYMEKSVRLEGTYWCYQPTLATPPVNELPAHGEGRVTFGCLNNFCKVSPETLETWAALLQRIEQARLVLYCPPGNHRDRVKAALGDRVELVDHLSPEKYFDLYHRVDIALDTFPCGGATTTCDALWMGVPVVTLRGRTAVGRAGASILSNAGLPELIAGTREQYVQIAADLAGDLGRLAELRANLRQRLRDSALMDGRRFVRGVEDAYRAMWRKWCA